MHPVSFPLWAWIVLGLSLAVLLTIDLYSHRTGHGSSRRAAVVWSLVWIGAGLLFNVFLWIFFGSSIASEYLATYLIEKSLSVDNLFVFLVIFRSLKIPEHLQTNVLIWGIFGALIFRAIFIVMGAHALERWGWISWVFGAMLIYTAWRMLRDVSTHEQENRLVRWLANRLPVTSHIEGRRLFVYEMGKKKATPLFLALLVVESSDILFALDSVPAALAVTRHTYVVYSSNAFAMLGLRALYGVIAASLTRLPYLHYGLAAVLAFAGAKLFIGDWIEIPPIVSVGVILTCMSLAILFSIKSKR